MSKAKRNKKLKAAQHAVAQCPSPAKGGKKTLKLPYFPLLFVLLWLFGSMVYGDVFYMSQQTSFFAFNSTLMASVLNQDFGLVNAAGRFLLLSFRYPVLGGALLALMLTLCAWLIDYMLGHRSRLHWIAMLMPFVFLSYFVALDYSVNYMRETSVLMSVPLCVLLVLVVVALVKRIATHKRLIPIYKAGQSDSPTSTWITCAVAIAAFAGLTGYCSLQRENIIKTCRMQRMLEQSDWYSMIDEVVSAKRPARSVAAYFALALAETGQLENRLFEIPYDFPKTTVTSPDEKENDGVLIYSIDGDFYAGLVNSSYHSAMETLVRRGPQVFALKRLARAAAMNGESALCRKYLEVLKLCGVEDAFVERYSAYADNPATMHREPEFMHVAAKMPLHDSFEQNYRTPYFIGYNVALRDGRSSEALRTSIMACLYAKETGFMNRVILLRDSVLSPYMEQAVTVQAVRTPNLIDMFNFDKQMNLARFEAFVNDARPWLKTNEIKKGFEKLKGSWLNYYPFYLYFQNYSSANRTAQPQKTEKGGVN